MQTFEFNESNRVVINDLIFCRIKAKVRNVEKHKQKKTSCQKKWSKLERESTF